MAKTIATAVETVQRIHAKFSKWRTEKRVGRAYEKTEKRTRWVYAKAKWGQGINDDIGISF